jgi:hypothetical protein
MVKPVTTIKISYFSRDLNGEIGITDPGLVERPVSIAL